MGIFSRESQILELFVEARHLNMRMHFEPPANRGGRNALILARRLLDRIGCFGASHTWIARLAEFPMGVGVGARTRLDLVHLRFSKPDAEEPYRYAQTWTREATTGPDRLWIGCGESPLDVIKQLASLLDEPLYALVVLMESRHDSKGRYETDPLTYVELRLFIAEFAPLFSNDGRADLWIGSTTNYGLLVLDEHDLVYAYGPLNAFAAHLDAGGFAHGTPDVPYPHAHYYNKEYDELEARLIAREWCRVLPLYDDEHDGDE